MEARLQTGWFANAASPQKVMHRTQTLAGQKKTKKIEQKAAKITTRRSRNHKGRGVGVWACRRIGEPASPQA
jgi:hypothetical protein